MNSFLDARIPVLFGDAAEAGPTDALLIEGLGAWAAGRAWFTADAARAAAHPAGCACCTPRGGAAQALSRLMLARGRGDGVFFSRVVVVARSAAGRRAVAQALAEDPLAMAWFRLLA